MKRTERWLWLTAALVCLSFSPAMGAPKWISIGEFQAGGDGKVAAYNGPVSVCRIVCTDGSVIVNTVIVLEGQKKTPISVGVRIPAGQMHEIVLPGGHRTVTGFRISDNARGKYRLEVLKVWTGKEEAESPGATATGSAKKKAKKIGKKAEPLPDDESGEQAIPVPQPFPASPELLPAPAGLPQPVEPEAPSPKAAPVDPVKSPDLPATPQAPLVPAGGASNGGAAPLPWEVN